MDLQLTDKKVFISGSTQGIGFAVAAACLAEGASVTINGRDQARVSQAVTTLRETTPGGTVDGVVADLCDADATEAVLDRIGDVDILVNNVGTFDVADFAQVSDADWLRHFEINVMAGMRLSRHLLGPMLARNWGRIIFVGTESAVDVPANMIHYGATKAASLAVANGLAKLTRGSGVTVNTVVGGPTYSNGVAAVVEQIAAARSITEAEMKERLVRPTSLLERFIEPSEIASLVTFLASPRSSATNGAAIRADGGVLTTIL